MIKHLLLSFFFITPALACADVIVTPFFIELDFTQSHPELIGEAVFLHSASIFKKIKVNAKGKQLIEAEYIFPCRSGDYSKEQLEAMIERINGEFLHLFALRQKVRLKLKHPWTMIRDKINRKGDTIRITMTPEMIVGELPTKMDESILSYVKKQARLKHITDEECFARYDCNESLAYLVKTTEFRGLRLEEIQDFTGVRLDIKESSYTPGDFIATLKQKAAWKKYKIRLDEQGVIVYFKRR